MTLLEDAKANSVGVFVYDPFSLNLSDFKWQNGFQKYVVQEKDVYKFYRVSESFYGTAEYEDIILLINNIEDPFDLTPGAVIFLPDLTELKSYLLTKQK